MATQQASTPPSEIEAPTASLTASNAAGPSAPTPPPTPAQNKKKRKATHEYSTNPNTVRVRERNASLGPYRLAVKRAKSNDMKAVASAWRDRINTESFQASSEDARRKILEDVEKAIMDRRRRKGIDASSKIFALNQERQPNGNGNAVAPPADGENEAAGPQPAMAPPGYIAFPTKPIQDLMEKNSSDAAAAPVVASSSAAATPVEDAVVVQPASKSIGASANSQTTAELKTAIKKLKTAVEVLKAQHEEMKLRHENDSIRQVAEAQELRLMVDGLKVQTQHMAAVIQSIQATRAPMYNYSPQAMTSHYTTSSAFQQPTQRYGALPGINGNGTYGSDDGYNANDGYATQGSYATANNGYVAEDSLAWRG